MLQKLTTLSNALVVEVSSYNEKPTKASSKRIRLLLGEIKTATPRIRAALVEADKAGN